MTSYSPMVISGDVKAYPNCRSYFVKFASAIFSLNLTFPLYSKMWQGLLWSLLILNLLMSSWMISLAQFPASWSSSVQPQNGGSSKGKSTEEHFQEQSSLLDATAIVGWTNCENIDHCHPSKSIHKESTQWRHIPQVSYSSQRPLHLSKQNWMLHRHFLQMWSRC